jgi:hypothetical protein
MKKIEKLLSGHDLRSIGNAGIVAGKIQSQRSFDNLFLLLYNKDRRIVMRTADAIEKITVIHPEFLSKHKPEVVNLLATAEHKELKWHLAQIVSRLPLSQVEAIKIFQVLTGWLKDENESRIVRVNSLDTLYTLSTLNTLLKADFERLISQSGIFQAPSLKARLKKLPNK